MAAVLPDPFYYLENFRHVLAWVGARHADLLAPAEQDLIARFHALPRSAQALLVRMVMRKGDLFRHGKLVYAEIGEIAPLAAALAEAGLIDAEPALPLEALFGLLRKEELLAIFRDPLARDGGTAWARSARKEDLLAHLAAHFPTAQTLREWHAPWSEPVYRLQHGAVYDRLRLLFFGNLYQDWSEFVLTDLGLLTYERVEIRPAARAFQTRADVDDYLVLHALRERLEAGEDPRRVGADVPAAPHANPWLEERRARLLFHLGQALEKEKDWPAALALYRQSTWPEARLRSVRVLELNGETAEAFALAEAILASAPREEEAQQLARMLPRLRRTLGLPKAPAETLQTPEPLTFTLAADAESSVEWLLAAHLHADDAPVFYVENALINSLFGLLCWPAIFAPVPGAFFHAFHWGPVDLHHPEFHSRREEYFAACLGRLEDGTHREAILAIWREKQGRQSPFVFWEALDEALLGVALDCIPAAHLKVLFARLLADLRNNRSGFPDLVQFWPGERRYQMIEVKGPGDRLQDNQVRWLDYCLQHDIPVAVAHVRWAESA
ncbi:MAG: hypothetical protein K0S46_1741 [Moraxellaceae bacterium]|jgi:hypothetical protein|nr:hypothetical protein [Moraxellaceae bacterium]